jgi:hypothetical protein
MTTYFLFNFMVRGSWFVVRGWLSPSNDANRTRVTKSSAQVVRHGLFTEVLMSNHAPRTTHHALLAQPRTTHHVLVSQSC